MKKTRLMMACLLFSVGILAADLAVVKSTADDEIQTPPEWEALLRQSQQVRDSKALMAQAKAVIAAQAANVEGEFSRVWAPWVEVVKEMKALRLKVEEAQANIEKHNNSAPVKPSLSDRAAVEKYNKDIVPYNDEAQRLNAAKNEAVAHAEKVQDGIRARGEAQIKKIEEWFTGESYRQFMKVTRGLLTGRIQWKEGLNWTQLLEAAKGYRDEMFDARAADDRVGQPPESSKPKAPPPPP